MQEQVRYYRSQVFVESEVIPEAEALSSGGYVAAHYRGEVLDYAEIHDGSLTQVIYYERPWPDHALAKAHLKKYGPCPFQIVTPTTLGDQLRIREIFHCDADGNLLGIDQEQLSLQGELVREVRMDASRQIIGTLEYEYGPDGRLSRVRELDPQQNDSHGIDQ